MKKIIAQFLIILAFSFLLSGKEDQKYYAKFYISDKTLEYFQNRAMPQKEIETIIMNYYNQVWEIFENNKEKIFDENIRNAIELFRLKLLTHEKKMEIWFDFDERYADYHKARREPGFFTIQKLKSEAQDVNGESDNRVDLQDENERKIAVIRILNGLGDCTMKELKYVDPRTGCEYNHILTHYECFHEGFETYPPIPWEWDYKDINYSIHGTFFHEIVHIALKESGLDRWQDEATVEDVTRQLFPGAKDSYEKKYYYGLVENEFRYTDETHRLFNPPIKSNDVDLKYHESKEIGIIKWMGRSEQEETSCDDAISLLLKPYVIPVVTMTIFTR